MNKRIFAMLMALAMIISMVPMGAMASEFECSHENLRIKDDRSKCCDIGWIMYECADCRQSGINFLKQVGPTGKHTYVPGECLLTAPEGGEDVPSGCAHEETFVDIFEASCVKTGTKKTVCKACGETVSEETLPTNDNHAFYEGVCVLCGESEQVEHVCVFVPYDEEPATCQFAAYVYEKCECGATRGREVGEPNPDAHNYVNGVCACGAEEPKAECEHEDTYVDIFEASCVKTGTKKTVCKACGETVSEETLPTNDNHAFHNGVCLLCGEAEAVECAHEETYVDIFEASCVKTGTKKTVCKACGETVSEETLPTNDNHAFHNGVCLLCGEAEAVECAHEETYVDIFEASCVKTGTKKTVCKACGETVSEETLLTNDNHAFYNGTCLLCGELEAPCTHDETYVDIFLPNCVKTGYEKVYCKACDELVAEYELPVNDDHAFLNGVCLLCGETDECKHNYEIVKKQDATCAKPAYVWYVCTECGEEMSREEGEVSTKHNYVVVKKLEATCTKPAYVWYECVDCGAEMNREEGEVSENHNYVVVKKLEATCTEPAYVWYECTACGEEMNREEGLADGEHVYENGTCTNCGEEDPDYVEPCDHHYRVRKIGRWTYKYTCEHCGDTYTETKKPCFNWFWYRWGK